MTGSRWSRRLGGVAATAGAVLISVLLAASVEAAPLFNLADASTLVVRGTVDAITPYAAAKLEVFRIRTTRVLKGQVGVGEPIDLAQEMLFETTKPYFARGTETLLMAVPLPHYTSFDKVLPPGTYWRWTERLETAADVGVLTDPALTEGVARYLSVRDDTEACADFLVSTLTGPNGRLRQDALSLVATRRELSPVLDAGRLQPLAAWLRHDDVPPADRAQVLVQLARAGVAGIADVAEGVASAEGPLQAPAVDALVTIDKPPAVARLLVFSKSADEALRLVASRGLLKAVTPAAKAETPAAKAETPAAKAETPAAVDRLAEMLSHDPSSTVRIAIAQGLGQAAPSERVVKLLVGAFDDAEKGVMLAAVESLGRLGSHDAIVALGAALDHGRLDLQSAAAFALKRSNKREAENLLEVTESTHPDPKVRRLCKLALGESMHEH